MRVSETRHEGSNPSAAAMNRTERYEMLVLAGVKPVSFSQRMQRSVRKSVNRALFNVELGFVILAASIVGVFSQKASSYFMTLAWLLIYSQES